MTFLLAVAEEILLHIFLTKCGC